MFIFTALLRSIPHSDYNYNHPPKMSNRTEREAEDFYESHNDPSPVSGRFADDSYTREPQSALKGRIPVQRDEDVEEDPTQPPFSNTDDQLGMFHFTHMQV